MRASSGTSSAGREHDTSPASWKFRPRRRPHGRASDASTGRVRRPQRRHDEVTVDGTPFEPEPPDRAWRRESVATILDTLTSQWGCPLRVEVRETDGTVFTDILTPTDRPNREPSATAQAAPRYPDSLHSEGLVPGEDVAIAVVIGHGQAGSDGTVGGLPTAVQAAASASSS